MEQNKDDREITFNFYGTITLKVTDVFIDDDAPEEVTSEEVATMIEGQYANIGNFIDDWGLGDNITCTISTSKKDGRPLNL